MNPTFARTDRDNAAAQAASIVRANRAIALASLALITVVVLIPPPGAG